MNKYPKWWNTTITVYNQYVDQTTNVVTWYRHTIEGCFWKYTGVKTTIGETILDTNTTICRIPKQDDYLPKGEWIKLPNEQLKDYLTLGQNDIIIKGIVEDEINEYLAGHRSSDLIAEAKQYGECMVINRVADNTSGGRNDEHYLVQGE